MILLVPVVIPRIVDVINGLLQQKKELFHSLFWFGFASVFQLDVVHSTVSSSARVKCLRIVGLSHRMRTNKIGLHLSKLFLDHTCRQQFNYYVANAHPIYCCNTYKLVPTASQPLHQSKPPVVTVSQGYMSKLVICWRAGSPWPVRCVSCRCYVSFVVWQLTDTDSNDVRPWLSVRAKNQTVEFPDHHAIQ